MKSSKKKYLYFGALLLTIMVLLFWGKGNNERNNIFIGVPMANSETYKYDLLKKDLEEQFNIEVTFVDLYKNIKQGDTEQDLMEDIYDILKKSEVDMVLGVPSHQLEYAVKDKLLLDITDKVLNIENLHKGVIDRSKKMGEGKLYYISPVVNHISLLFQNKEILEDMDIELLPRYASWTEFSHKLDEIQESINNNNSEYYPLALSVKNANEDTLFSAYDFQKLAYGLDSEIFEKDKFSERWKSFYTIFAKIIIKYGKDLKEMENGIYPQNYIYTNSMYAFMLGESYDAEVFFNQLYNNEYNDKAPVKIKPNFPMEVSYISYDATKTQNFRDTSIAISKKTLESEMALEILNYLIGKKYAYKIISNRSEYSHFSNSIFNYPTYYDEDTILELNKSYDGKFDAHLFYDVEYGSIINNTDQTNDLNQFNDILNEAFTLVYNNRLNRNINDIIEDSLKYIQDELKVDKR